MDNTTETTSVRSTIGSQKSIWGDPWKLKREKEDQLIEACSLGQFENARRLLDRSIWNENTPNVNAKRLDNWTPLHFAVEEDRADIVQLLLEQRGDPNRVSSTDRTPLHVACLRGNLEPIKLIFTKSCVPVDPNLQDDILYTALHYASQYGHSDIVDYLLSLSTVDVTITNQSGFTANDISLNGEVRDLFAKYSTSSNESVSDHGYGRKMTSKGLRHNDRESHVARLMRNFQDADKFLQKKNGDVTQLIDNIEEQQKMAEDLRLGRQPSRETPTKKKVKGINLKMKKFIKLVDLEKQKQN